MTQILDEKGNSTMNRQSLLFFSAIYKISNGTSESIFLNKLRPSNCILLNKTFASFMWSYSILFSPAQSTYRVYVVCTNFVHVNFRQKKHAEPSSLFHIWMHVKHISRTKRRLVNGILFVCSSSTVCVYTLVFLPMPIPILCRSC